MHYTHVPVYDACMWYMPHAFVEIHIHAHKMCDKDMSWSGGNII